MIRTAVFSLCVAAFASAGQVKVVLPAVRDGCSSPFMSSDAPLHKGEAVHNIGDDCIGFVAFTLPAIAAEALVSARLRLCRPHSLRAGPVWVGTKLASGKDRFYFSQRMGEDVVEFDVTRIVKDWLGGAPNLGFVLDSAQQRPYLDRYGIERHAFRTQFIAMSHPDAAKRPSLTLFYLSP